MCVISYFPTPLQHSSASGLLNIFDITNGVKKNYFLFSSQTLSYYDYWCPYDS